MMIHIQKYAKTDAQLKNSLLNGKILKDIKTFVQNEEHSANLRAIIELDSLSLDP